MTTDPTTPESVTTQRMPTDRPGIDRPILPGERLKAQRGLELRAKSWRTEGLLRMLENVLEVGEKPEELVVYAALGKAARDWDSYFKIRRALTGMDTDSTLMIQSGKPIGVFPTHSGAPRVLIANSNLVGRWATTEHFYELYDKNKIAWGGLTAGCWQYIGFQGVLQGTFETFAAASKVHFDQDDLKGRFVFTAGLGGMGSAQPLAIWMLGGVALVPEVNGERALERQAHGLVQHVTHDLDEAIALCTDARAKGEARSVTWVGNAVEALETLLERGIIPDIVTDMTSAHDALHGYQPLGLTTAQAAQMRSDDPDKLIGLARETMVRHVKALLNMEDAGAVAFDYGNNLRSQARDHGFPGGFRLKVFTEAYLRPLFSRGIGPFRWVALSGDSADIAYLDALTQELFPDDAPVQRWVRAARLHVPEQGLPARTAWLGHTQRTRMALAANAAVARGDIGPIAFTRDHLDAGSMAHPNIMTENLKDGTDAVSDWPLLNALLNTASGADLVAIHSGGGGYAGYMTSAGVTCIADGSEETAGRLERVMNADTGWGVLRYADAGYGEAEETKKREGLGLGF
ncbi:urocanate hydratase [Deinococcus ruber]|uniref:Urocanate hydratase n=1 Tax=Deinococcus ruber TaxID=1848197 RepID=A0A918CIU3_9DEIO|nr:urocanate hydratase [Deinococcus ruber]GGR25726.1 urocanate hydratase [Deinococcus ruber]